MSLGIRPPPPPPRNTRTVTTTAEGVVVFHRIDRSYRWGTDPSSKLLTETQLQRYVSDRTHALCIAWLLTTKGGT